MFRDHINKRSKVSASHDDNELFIAFQEKFATPIIEIVEKYLQGDTEILPTFFSRIYFKSDDENDTLGLWLDSHPKFTKRLAIEELTAREAHLISLLRFDREIAVSKNNIDATSTRKYREYAVTLGDPLALFISGMYYLDMNKLDLATQFINKAIEHGCVDAISGKAILYIQEKGSIEDADLPVLETMLQKPIEVGSGPAYNLLMSLNQLRGNSDKYLYYVKTGTSHGLPLCLLDLIEQYTKGRVSFNHNINMVSYCEFLQLIFRPTILPPIYTRAAHCHSLLYSKGIGVEKNKGKAACILRESLEHVSFTPMAKILKDALLELLRENPNDGEVCFHGLIALRFETEIEDLSYLVNPLDDLNQCIFKKCFFDFPEVVIDNLLKYFALSNLSLEKLEHNMRSHIWLGLKEATSFFDLHPIFQNPALIAKRLRCISESSLYFYKIKDFFQALAKEHWTNLSVLYHLNHAFKHYDMELFSECLILRLLVMDNFSTFLKLCNEDKRSLLPISFSFLSQDTQAQIGFWLSVAFSALSQWSPTHPLRLPLDLVKMIFNEIAGDKVASEFLNKRILADETVAERKANLTLIKFEKKLLSQHSVFQENRSKLITAIDQAKKGESSSLMALEYIKRHK